MQNLFSSVKEAMQSVLPIAVIVFLLSISFSPLNAGIMVLFLFGTIMLIAGMSFFYNRFFYFYGTIRWRNWCQS